MSTPNLKSNTASPQDSQEFLFAVTHDLKQPVHTIRRFSGLLREKLAKEPDQETGLFLSYICDAADGLQTLIDQTLSYARAEGGWQRGPVKMDQVMQFVVSISRSSILETGAIISSDRLPTVTGNFAALAQVIQNLVANAIKYNVNYPPRIHVGCVRRGAEYRFSVTDNGVGIAPEHTEEVFLPLKRLRSRHHTSGTGLGLSICKRIVESHGGRIWCESNPGPGARFYFTIPAPRPEAVDQEAADLTSA